MMSSSDIVPSAVEMRGSGGSGEPATIATELIANDDADGALDFAALDDLAAALTTDYGAVDVCRRVAGFLLAHVPGTGAVQITMHGATSDAPPQVFTFPRRPSNAENAKSGDRSDKNAAAHADGGGGETSADEARPSSERNSTDTGTGNSDTTSLVAVSGSHAGSDRAISWSVSNAAGPSPSSSQTPTPPYSDWRSLADWHSATAFLTVPASVSGRPRASLTVAGDATMFPLPPSPAAAAAAATASAVAALLAPYLALAAVRRQLDVSQALLADVMPHSVMAGVVERRALGLALAMLGRGGGGGGGGGSGGGRNARGLDGAATTTPATITPTAEHDKDSPALDL